MADFKFQRISNLSSVYSFLLLTVRCCDQWSSRLDMWSCKCNFFCAYRPYKESISKEMNNSDNDLNLYSMTKLSGWVHYWLRSKTNVARVIVGSGVKTARKE